MHCIVYNVEHFIVLETSHIIWWDERLSNIKIVLHTIHGVLLLIAIHFSMLVYKLKVNACLIIKHIFSNATFSKKKRKIKSIIKNIRYTLHAAHFNCYQIILCLCVYVLFFWNHQQKVHQILNSILVFIDLNRDLN